MSSNNRKNGSKKKEEAPPKEERVGVNIFEETEAALNSAGAQQAVAEIGEKAEELARRRTSANNTTMFGGRAAQDGSTRDTSQVASMPGAVAVNGSSNTARNSKTVGRTIEDSEAARLDSKLRSFATNSQVAAPPSAAAARASNSSSTAGAVSVRGRPSNRKAAAVSSQRSIETSAQSRPSDRKRAPASRAAVPGAVASASASASEAARLDAKLSGAAQPPATASYQTNDLPKKGRSVRSVGLVELEGHGNEKAASSRAVNDMEGIPGAFARSPNGTGATEQLESLEQEIRDAALLAPPGEAAPAGALSGGILSDSVQVGAIAAGTAAMAAEKPTKKTQGDTGGEGLVEAQPVSGDVEYGSIAIARSADDDDFVKQQQDDKIRSFAIRLGVLVCIVIGIVVVVVVIVVPNDDDGGGVFPTTDAPTISPTPAPTAFVIELPEFTVQAILQDSDSPQAQAYQWLRGDPNLDGYSSTKLSQRMALATLYYATNGGNWTVNRDWMSYEVDDCKWYSKIGLAGSVYEPPDYTTVTGDAAIGNNTCDEQGNYLELVLPRNYLQGSIPKELAILSTLKRADLSENPLSGTIPTELGLMTNLEGIVFSGDDLIGTLPSEIGSMLSLDLLVLAGGGVTGTIPTEIGNLENIEVFNILFSEISGTVPSEIQKMSNLVHFGENVTI